MNWDEFNKTDLQVMYDGQVKTDIDCPICGKKVLWDSRITLTSLPPKYHYWCTCGWGGDSYRKWGEGMSDLELCYTCERYGECDVYGRLSSPGHDLLYSCVNYVPTSAKDIDVPNTDLSDYSTELALLELEHRYGKEVRDRIEQMGFVIPKTGRWIKNQRKSKFHIEPIYICSCCKEQEAWGEMELSNYCPNCGAKMEGEEDGH